MAYDPTCPLNITMPKSGPYAGERATPVIRVGSPDDPAGEQVVAHLRSGAVARLQTRGGDPSANRLDGADLTRALQTPHILGEDR